MPMPKPTDLPKALEIRKLAIRLIIIHKAMAQSTIVSPKYFACHGKNKVKMYELMSNANCKNIHPPHIFATRNVT